MAREANAALATLGDGIGNPSNLLGHSGNVSEAVQGRMHVALQRASRERTWRVKPLTEERREAFLTAITAGFGIDHACDYADCTMSGIYALRRRDPEFAKDWEDALDASVGPLERSLEDVAFNAPIDSMARVNAAKALLAARSSRHNPKPSTPNMSATMQAPNGSAVTFRVGGSLPD